MPADEEQVVMMAQEAAFSGSLATRAGWLGQPEYHYTVAELAEAWNVSTDFIRSLFRDESDVIRWVHCRPGKRRYVVVRIPGVVAERVYRRAQRG